MSPYRVPEWVNQRKPHGHVELLGRKVLVSLDEAERLGERIAILTVDGGCDEETAQRHAVLDLQQRRMGKAEGQGPRADGQWSMA